MTANGKFICLEGIDGSGTTTQAQRLVDWLEQRGVPAHLTQEPSDLPIGRLIRQYLSSGDCPAESMALLFAADRVDHLQNEIRPALESGVTVVSDRYLLSSLAYQSVGCDFDWVRQINQHASLSDLTVILRVDPQVAANRRQHRGGAQEIYEVPQFQLEVAAWYDRLPEKLADETIVTLDANNGADQVFLALLGEVSTLFPGLSL